MRKIALVLLSVLVVGVFASIESASALEYAPPMPSPRHKYAFWNDHCFTGSNWINTTWVPEPSQHEAYCRFNDPYCHEYCDQIDGMGWVNARAQRGMQVGQGEAYHLRGGNLTEFDMCGMGLTAYTDGIVFPYSSTIPSGKYWLKIKAKDDFHINTYFVDPTNYFGPCVAVGLGLEFQFEYYNTWEEGHPLHLSQYLCPDPFWENCTKVYADLFVQRFAPLNPNYPNGWAPIGYTEWNWGTAYDKYVHIQQTCAQMYQSGQWYVFAIDFGAFIETVKTYLAYALAFGWLPSSVPTALIWRDTEWFTEAIGACLETDTEYAFLSTTSDTQLIVSAKPDVASTGCPAVIADCASSGAVDTGDIAMVGYAFGSHKFDGLRWTPFADVNNDGVVDGVDHTIVCWYFGETQLPFTGGVQIGVAPRIKIKQYNYYATLFWGLAMVKPPSVQFYTIEMTLTYCTSDIWHVYVWTFEKWLEDGNVNRVRSEFLTENKQFTAIYELTGIDP